MEIEILEQQCGGTEFVPRPHRLHLGAQNAEGVDRLQFILPAAWAGCTLALYLRRSDGVQLAAIPLDADDSVTVDRRLTGSVRGQWMLAAIGSGGYTAYTRPGIFKNQNFSFVIDDPPFSSPAFFSTSFSIFL